jgi:hypothetical protein
VVGVRRSAKNTNSKGTAVKKSSQIQPVGATAFPERVDVAMAEIAENMSKGLLALAVGAGSPHLFADRTTTSRNGNCGAAAGAVLTLGQAICHCDG